MSDKIVLSDWIVVEGDIDFGMSVSVNGKEIVRDIYINNSDSLSKFLNKLFNELNINDIKIDVEYLEISKITAE